MLGSTRKPFQALGKVASQTRHLFLPARTGAAGLQLRCLPEERLPGLLCARQALVASLIYQPDRVPFEEGRHEGAYTIGLIGGRLGRGDRKQ